ncbi:hypothetical protein [Streptomyces sp. HUAS TT20]|uniref:hypothetical protein n=1 Tax=Streptomyces sp. HUAS TT20 TaxID=3447509 RepID=UPI0021D886C3|nr:hypothetical protein [Streptomyces sp. HUAS 15-9]UXY27479.1 hypothetical protein N8I87_13390 [Streptomyces sp. HUAS 15-9]
MGALRTIRHRPRGPRVVAVAGLAVVAVGGAVACRPGDLSTASVAYTTDKTATAELEYQHVDVRWLTCTGNYGNKGYTAGKTPSPTESTVVSVDCQGQTNDGRKITVTGKVTKAVDGACVRGDLVAKVGGKEWFHVKGLGNCNARPGPTYTPPVTYRPPGGQQPGPTVTVTRTIWCKGDPTCWPVEGK